MTSQLFSPFRVGGLTLANRIVIAPMCQYSAVDGRMKITWPRAETPTHWMVMGLHPNLEEAMKMAVRETILFITQRFPDFRARRPT